MQVSAFWSDTAGQGQDFERFDEETGRLGRSKPEVGLGEATDAGEDEPATLRQRTYGLLDLSAQVAGWGQPQRGCASEGPPRERGCDTCTGRSATHSGLGPNYLPQAIVQFIRVRVPATE